jgi:predicted Zn-dependent peptidase
MAEKVKIWFEDLPVYTTFSSPRWTCRVGDFQTREEAMELLTTMRETGRFPKAIIVKSKINIREDELRREEPNTSTAGDSAAHNSYFGTLGRGPQ